MDIPFKKRINAQLFVDKTVAFSVGESQIRVVTNEADQQVGTNWFKKRVYIEPEKKGVGMKGQVSMQV